MKGKGNLSFRSVQRPKRANRRRCTHCNGLYQEAPPERGTFYMLQVYERVGISLVEIYEREGKSVISVCTKAQKS